jgi:hypothetical protein
VIIVEGYILALLYFATAGTQSWWQRLELESVCEWIDVVCNGDDWVVSLDMGKSKH